MPGAGGRRERAAVLDGHRVAVLQEEESSGDEWWVCLHSEGMYFRPLTWILRVGQTVNFILGIFYHT